MRIPPTTDECLLVSLDVKSMYTSIPQQEGIDSLLNKSDIIGLPIYKPEDYETTQQLATKTYFKETNMFQYIHFFSHHPIAVKMSVLFSEILRIKAQCTEEREFKKLKVDFTKHFLQRGYPFALIKAAVQKVEGMPGHDTVIRRNQEVMPLKIEFDKRIANIHKVLREQQHEINDSPELQFLNYNTRLLVAFRNKRNVRQLTTSSALEKDKVLNPVLGEPHNWGFSLMTKKCDNYQCMVCPYLYVGNAFKSTTTKRRISINCHLTCCLQNIIYVLQCKSVKDNVLESLLEP